MIIESAGSFLVGRLERARLSGKDRQALLALANEETEEELIDLMDEADSIADPLALYSVCPVEEGRVGGVDTFSEMVVSRLQDKVRAFPYIVTCGPKLEEWSKKYASDFLLEYWADEIKKRFLGIAAGEFRSHIKERYRTAGHLAALNPGSLAGWPISGQAALFDMLGGPDFVRETIGVTYSDSFLMFPTKTISGIAFESEAFYENCQYCPLENCPNRRAKRLAEV